MKKHGHPPGRQALSINRRSVLKAGAGLAAVAAIGFPNIVRAQSDKILIGHLTPNDRVPRSARRMGRPWHPDGGGRDQRGRRRHGPSARSQLRGLDQSRHRRHQGDEDARTRWRIAADGRDQLGLGAGHLAGCGAQQAAVHGARPPFGHAARQELQPVHVLHRHPQYGDGQRRGQCSPARQYGEGQEIPYADRGLCLRPRSAAGGKGYSSMPTARC